MNNEDTKKVEKMKKKKRHRSTCLKLDLEVVVSSFRKIASVTLPRKPDIKTEVKINK